LVFNHSEHEPALGPEREAIRHAMREGMSRLPSGVVVLTNWVDGRPWGTTLSSCTSLSMEPPLLLACLTNDTVSTRAILEQCCFGINLLGSDQIGVAERGAAPGQPKFMDDLVFGDVEMGSPAIRNAIVNVHCELYNSLVVGDHTIMVGEVRDVGFGEARSPLIYFNRDFYDLLEHRD
jgi:flavin reductase ActVB